MDIDKTMKRVVIGLSCVIIFMSSFLVSTQPAFAEFNRGVARPGRFDSRKVKLEKGLFRQDEGYIRERELRRRTPLHRRVNVYDKYGKKKGYAIEKTRGNGFTTYDENHRRTGFYRKKSL